MHDSTWDTANALRLVVGMVRRGVRDGGFPALSGGEATALSRIDRSGPLTAADLARLEGITPQSMGTTVAGLLARGLLVRERDPGDGRRVLLSVSDDGRGVLRRAKDSVTERLAAALEEQCTVEEIELIRAAAPLIERVAHAL